MKIINLGRGQGKTVRLLYASEWQDTPILCRDHKAKQNLLYRAQQLGLQIPEPIAVSDLTCETIKSSDLIENGVFVDEAHWVLQQLLKNMGMKGEVKAITLSEKEN